MDLVRCELGARLSSERQNLLNALAGLKEAEAAAPGAVGRWSIKDVVSHVIAWEETAAHRLELIAAGRGDEIRYVEASEVDEWNERVAAARRSVAWEELLGELNRVRERLLKAIGDWDPEHPATGWASVSGWLPNDSYLHDAEHASQILEWRRHRGLRVDS